MFQIPLLQQGYRVLRAPHVLARCPTRAHATILLPGGRVTDDKDRLLLATLLERCVCAPLVDAPEAYSFSSAPQQSSAGDSLGGGGSGGGAAYSCPADGPCAGYVAYVEGLPPAADPGAFGLHSNADIAKDINATDAMLGSLLAMGNGEAGGGDAGGGGPAAGGGAGGGSAGGGGARSEEARLASVVAECLEALPAPFDIEAAGARFPVSYEESMNTVLVQVHLWGHLGACRSWGAVHGRVPRSAC